MNKKRSQFFGELYTGERAELKPTSVRLPAGFLQDLSVICKEHGTTQSAFLAACAFEGMGRQLAEDRGNIFLQIENPQYRKPATEKTRAETMALLSDIAALKIDERAGFKTGIADIVNYHFEKLCKENNGSEFTGNYVFKNEYKKIFTNAKGKEKNEL